MSKNIRKRPDVTVKLILKYKDRILILKDKRGTITIPGGRMEWGESILGALRRELKEELNYFLEEEPELFDIWNYISKDGERHSVMIYFIKELDKKLEFSSPEKLETLWLTKKEIVAMNIIKDRDFLDRIFYWKVKS